MTAGTPTVTQSSHTAQLLCVDESRQRLSIPGLSFFPQRRNATEAPHAICPLLGPDTRARDTPN